MLADEFFFVAHDDYGQRRLFGSALGYGLAAALLAELHFTGRITFADGRVRVRDMHPPADPLQHLILDRLAAEPECPTRTWLAYVADTAYTQVARRMCHAGLLAPQQVGRLWRQRTVYRPVDINDAAWPGARLSQRLRGRRTLGDSDRVLAGLVLHTQLDSSLLDGAPLSARLYLREVVDGVQPPVRELFGDLAAAVGNAVLSHRT
ncbi:GOLPH3/VPS74 family protein [Micromonospora yangpuensis]|uniref:GOLPH3/VPS74 family protein n=1 Tax=Micromonospora yangpuensis TaxID=683228 RepID=UPI001E382EEF|nr:GPP34 family phosphoprotein [Micromonospora yangpuensis]